MRIRQAFPIVMAELVMASLAVPSSALGIGSVEQRTPIESTSSTGALADRGAVQPMISADGRHLAFVSGSTNLASGDWQGDDVFIKDLETQVVTIVSASLAGGAANGDSEQPTISADGRYVAFASTATNLVASDTNGVSDIFVRDLSGGTTRRVSVSSTGAQANGASGMTSGSEPAISDDGSTIAFQSAATNLVNRDTNGVSDVFARALATGKTTRVDLSYSGKQANGPAGSVAISGTGRYVTYSSSASNLVPNDTNAGPNYNGDVFLRDRQAATTSRISVASDGTETEVNTASFEPDISADGGRIVFASNSRSLTPEQHAGVFLRDVKRGVTEMVSKAFYGGPVDAGWPAISADGSTAAFVTGAGNVIPEDRPNLASDVYVRNIDSGAVDIASISNNGERVPYDKNTPTLSANGRRSAFASVGGCFIPGDDVAGLYLHDFDVISNAHLTFTGSTEAPYDDEVTIAARLVDNSGDPLVGRLVHFSIENSHSTDAVTDSDGVARSTIRNDISAESIVGMRAGSAGDIGVPPLATCTRFVSSKRASDLTIDSPNRIVKGEPATIHVHLSDAERGTPIPGSAIVMFLDADPSAVDQQSTDTSGDATLVVQPGDYGTHHLRIEASSSDFIHQFASGEATILVDWQYRFTDDSGGGSILVNQITDELQVLLPGFESSVKQGTAQSNAAGWTTITYNDPSMDLRGAFNFSTMQFLSVVRPSRGVFALRHA